MRETWKPVGIKWNIFMYMYVYAYMYIAFSLLEIVGLMVIIRSYTSGTRFQFASENGPFLVDFLFKMVIFQGYVSLPEGSGYIIPLPIHMQDPNCMVQVECGHFLLKHGFEGGV